MTLTSLEICTGASDGSNAADYGVFNAVQIQGLDQVLEAERRHRDKQEIRARLQLRQPFIGHERAEPVEQVDFLWRKVDSAGGG